MDKGVALVAVDDVFHADGPMSRHDDYHLAKHHTGRRYPDGHAVSDQDRRAAQRIVEDEILQRFGGVTVDPAFRAEDLSAAQNAVRTGPGWASGPGARAMPVGHPAAVLGSPDAAHSAVPAPPLPGFVPGPAPEPGELEAPLPPLSAEELAKRLIDGLVRGLDRSGGNLDLAVLAGLLDGQTNAAQAWTIALGFIASQPELTERVRSVTIGTFDKAGLPHAVVLPPEASKLISFSEGPHTVTGPGPDTRAATLNWPEWL
jgi:hypothetical protein